MPKTILTSLRQIGRGAARLGLGLAFVLALLMASTSLLGLHRYIITGGSMTGSIDRGSLVYDRVVPTSTLHVGDVITYRPPRSSVAPEGLVTHRIVWIGHDRSGKLGFRTKGDANAAADPWRFTLGPRQAKVVAHVPTAGYVLAWLSGRNARLLIIGLPALLVALSVLSGLWQDAGREAAEPAPAPEVVAR